MLGDAGWGPALTVASSTEERGFFVNWADFASVEILEPDLLVAHWLVRGPDGGYDYGIRVAQSTDGGLTWTEPLRPHTDETRTEHGFVSKFPLNDGGTGLVWLDARNSVDMDGQKGTPGAMALRYRSLDPDGVPGLESVLDERVHRDGWVIPACPVNGPAVAARGDELVVAWFTGVGNERKAQVAFSSDGGVHFGEAIRVDDGTSLGRVDVLWLENGSALVMWVERRPRVAEILVRQVWPDGRIGEDLLVTTTSAARDSGFPQMIRDGMGRVVFAWTQAGNGGRVRVARTSEDLQ
jgi:hypothetical protein